MSTFTHRWRRSILHGVACIAVVGSGAVGMLHSSRSPALVARESLADVTNAPVPDADASGLLAGRPPLPEPTQIVDELPATSNAATPSAPDPQAQLTMRTYVVEAGDAVRTIAQQFGVTNETIIWENDLTDPDVLEVGQELHILPFSGLLHEVRPGDTVASIANSYAAPVQAVIEANKLSDPYIIVVGQTLAVPGGYRPLSRKVQVVSASPDSAPDTVQPAPGQTDRTDQLAAAINTPPKHRLPVLGGTPQEQFIMSIAEAAVESADTTGVPASVTIAQAILESYWGSSRLATEANNYFGIKAQTSQGSAGSISFNVWEVIGGRNVMELQAFRAYKTVADSFVDHGLFFVTNGRYAAALAARNDPRQFAREVNRAGYATDPSYASKLIGLMDRYDLYRYDAV